MKKSEIKKYEYPTITELLKSSGYGRENQILFIQEGKPTEPKIDYRQWHQDLLYTAGKIQAMEANHIGVVCDLTYECIVCLYAVMVAGKVLVPLEADLDEEAISKCIERADVDLVLYHEERVDGEITGCKTMEIPEFMALSGEGLKEWPVWEEDRDACIFFTSGTEGEPHGVVLSQKNMSFINSYSSANHLGRNAKVLLFLPIHHVFSFLVLTSCIHDGCEIHLSRSLKYVAQELQDVRPDALTTVPLVNELFRSKITKGIEESGMKEKIKGLIRLSNGLRKIGIDLRTPLFQKLRDSFGGIPQLIVTGGSAVSEESIEFFDDMGIIILQAYGMTETSGSISTNSLEKNRRGSVGHIHWFNEVRIRDSEIQVRGANIMKGYYKNPEATAGAFDEGWFRTGDLGYFDKEGYLYITGRKKNLIILDNGENVSPEELEKNLLKCPCIEEVVVCVKEHHLHAMIFAKPIADMDVESMKKGIDGAILAWNQKNPVYKRIASWELKKEPFEKTSSLKIRR